MKRLFWLAQIVVIVALVLLSACRGDGEKTLTTPETVMPVTTEVTTATTTDTVLVAPRCVSPTMPADFYIIYETNWSAGPLLNTYNNVIGKPLNTYGGYISADFLYTLRGFTGYL